VKKGWSLVGVGGVWRLAGTTFPVWRALLLKYYHFAVLLQL
jgi:hypothetical protein